MPVRTVVERGPKGKRSVAFTLDWPGWSRGARTSELALEVLESYRERYRPVASIAGMAQEFEAAGPLEVVEDRIGTGSTDFWGISFSPSAAERGPMSEADLERAITLLQACWTFFDGVAARVSPEMRRGPRGGGRDRDRIIRHTIRTESEDFAKQVGLRIPEGAALTRTGCASIGRPTSPPCARTTPARSRGACGRGRCRSSSGTRRSTRSTTRGRWRTRTCRAERAADPLPVLAALAACQEVTLRMVAANVGIDLEGLEVVVEGDWDPRGTLVMGREFPIGLTAIRCATRVTIAEGATGERAERLLRSAERYCVVLDTLRGGVPVESTFTVESAG